MRGNSTLRRTSCTTYRKNVRRTGPGRRREEAETKTPKRVLEWTALLRMLASAEAAIELGPHARMTADQREIITLRCQSRVDRLDIARQRAAPKINPPPFFRPKAASAP
jgi:hypothetical protein